MLANVLADYALEVPFSEPHTYRLDRDDDNERWLVKAKSVLENGSGSTWRKCAKMKQGCRRCPSCGSGRTTREGGDVPVNDEQPTKKNPTMVLVSACLLGVACRYDGESKPNERILSYNREYSFIPFCPETYGGLSTPRLPAEIQPDGRVINSEGEDVTAAYAAGAERAVTLCRDFHIHYAILKSRSPACGPKNSYDAVSRTRLWTARAALRRRCSMQGSLCFQTRILTTPRSVNKTVTYCQAIKRRRECPCM